MIIQASDRLADMLGAESEALRIWYRKMEAQKNKDALKNQKAIQKRVRDFLKDHFTDEQNQDDEQVSELRFAVATA